MDRLIVISGSALIALLLAACCLTAAEKSAFTIHYVRFTPTAIFSDGGDATSFTARILGPVKRVFILPDRYAPGVAEPAQLTIDGKTVTEVELFDNGSHGDQKKGDRVFTRAGIRYTGGGTSSVFSTMRIVDNDGVVHTFYSSDYGGGSAPTLYLVARSQKAAVKTVDSSWRVSKRVANLRSTAIFNPTDSTSTTADPDLNAVRAAFLTRFPDVQDFIAVYITQPCRISYYYFVHYRNEIKGIGLSPLETPGSVKLRGMLFLQNTPGPFLHEVMHDWGVFLNNQEFTNNPHWGAVNVPGLLWGMDFEPAGNGKYRVTVPFAYGVYAKKPVRYPPMELYLMGLVPPEQVPPVTVLEGINASDYHEGDLITPPGVKTVTMANIIAVNGVRVPGVAGSQKKFQTAAVLLSGPDFATDAEMAAFTLFQKNLGLKKAPKDEIYGRSFVVATGGRAKMVAKVPKPLAPGAPRPSPSRFGAGRIVTCPGCADTSHRHIKPVQR